MSNLGRWAAKYDQAVTRQPYADTATYRLGADWLAGCGLVEDWGCGLGWLRTLIPEGRYRGLDGTASMFADEVVDLADYRSSVPGVFMRHVLEHNYGWQLVLDNAVASFTERMALILFTPMAPATHQIGPFGNDGIDVPNISFRHQDLAGRFGSDVAWRFEDLKTGSFYGTERIYYLERKPT
jgi:hypothetical protein